jgi:hypothetical protein
MFAAAASANAGTHDAFDNAAARSMVESLASRLSACREIGSKPSPLTVEVSFAPSGIAIGAKVGTPYGGTAPGGCMESALKSVRVKPFSGATATVKTSVQLR